MIPVPVFFDFLMVPQFIDFSINERFDFWGSFHGYYDSGLTPGLTKTPGNSPRSSSGGST